jgi:hypothetical protein
MCGIPAKIACLLETHERTECNSRRLGALCMLTVASLWNFTAKSVQITAAGNLMSMRSLELSIGKDGRWRH